MSASQGQPTLSGNRPASNHPLETAIRILRTQLAEGTSDKSVGEAVVHLDQELSQPD